MSIAFSGVSGCGITNWDQCQAKVWNSLRMKRPTNICFFVFVDCKAKCRDFRWMLSLEHGNIHSETFVLKIVPQRRTFNKLWFVEIFRSLSWTVIPKNMHTTSPVWFLYLCMITTSNRIPLKSPFKWFRQSLFPIRVVMIVWSLFTSNHKNYLFLSIGGTVWDLSFEMCLENHSHDYFTSWYNNFCSLTHEWICNIGHRSHITVDSA